ncbi:MAG: hypothetical protein Q9M19_03140 [Mariprofundaceae bacterium]|nr:hypothetical protein [Mariprofundaceae bacterium]
MSDFYLDKVKGVPEFKEDNSVEENGYGLFSELEAREWIKMEQSYIFLTGSGLLEAKKGLIGHLLSFLNDNSGVATIISFAALVVACFALSNTL